MAQLLHIIEPAKGIAHWPHSRLSSMLCWLQADE
jgi:hypothetical protein